MVLSCYFHIFTVRAPTDGIACTLTPAHTRDRALKSEMRVGLKIVPVLRSEHLATEMNWRWAGNGGRLLT